MRAALPVSIAAVLLTASASYAQPRVATYDWLASFSEPRQFPLLVGPGRSYSLPCTPFGTRAMRLTPNPFCLSDTEMREIRTWTLATIAAAPPARVIEPVATRRERLLPAPPAREVTETPMQPETRKLLREAKPIRRTAGTARGSETSGNTGAGGRRAAHAGHASRGEASPASRRAAERVIPVRQGAPAVTSGTPNEPSGGRAQRIP